MIRTTQSPGFTAVELLITLFVAAAFVATGYQLFNLVIKDGGDTRAEAVVSNVAYDYLRRYTHTATNPCAASTPLSNQSIAITNIADPKITVSITCPQSATTSLSKVEVSISYGTSGARNTVKYATYVDKSRGKQ